MASQRSLLSDAAKMRIAEELGVADIVATEGWGGVPSRQCGGVVAVAVRIAERALAAGQRPPRAGEGRPGR
jgi:small acid-soluble spore protein F (minor alpha/beta-type SASP)